MKTVLIIDDELYMRIHLPHMLERFGAKAITADGATEGIRLFKECKPDMVFLDITLVDGHGLQIFHKIKDIDPQAKICFISANDQVMDKLKSLNLGALAFLKKPFYVEDIQKLLDLI